MKENQEAEKVQKETLGKRKFESFIKKNRIQKNDIAKKLGISRVTLYRYINQPHAITEMFKFAIEKFTNGYIKYTDWEKE